MRRLIGGWVTGRRKPVAAAGDRLDRAALLAVEIENPAQPCDLHRQIGFLDRRARPDRPHDRVFRHDIAMPLDQQPQQIEGAGAEYHRFDAARLVQPEQAAGFEPEAVEQKAATKSAPIHGRLRRRRCCSASTIFYSAPRIARDPGNGPPFYFFLKIWTILHRARSGSACPTVKFNNSTRMRRLTRPQAPGRVRETKPLPGRIRG